MSEKSPSEAPEVDQARLREEIRGRAMSGAAVLGVRGALVMVAGVGINLALARLLSPRDFGYVALGTALVVVGQYLSVGGFGLALIRQPEPPERRQLSAVLGLQMAAAGFFTLVAALFAALGGRAEQIIALMAVSLPVLMLRLPAFITLERDLRFRSLAIADVLEAAAFYLWALATVLAGWGVWGLASAAIVRAVVGSAAVVRMARIGLVRPSLDWRAVRPLFGFGIKLQGASAAFLAREYGLVAGVGWVGGIASLGIWSFAYRIMQIPLLVYRSLQQVSFPAMSRMIEAGEDPRPLIEQIVGVVAAGVAIIVVGIAAGAPAGIAALAGDRWDSAAEILLWSGLGYLLWIPVSVAANGYLLAVGEAGLILLASLAEAVAVLAVSLAFLPVIGVEAIGLGWLAVGVVSLLVRAGAVKRRSGASIVRHLIRPVALAVPAGAIGWIVSSSGPETVPTAIAGVIVAEAILIGGMLIFARDLLRRLVDLSKVALSGALGWPGEEPLAMDEVVRGQAADAAHKAGAIGPGGTQSTRR